MTPSWGGLSILLQCYCAAEQWFPEDFLLSAKGMSSGSVIFYQSFRRGAGYLFCCSATVLLCCRATGPWGFLVWALMALGWCISFSSYIVRVYGEEKVYVRKVVVGK